MESRDFCYWLQGYLEITAAGDNADDLTSEQVQCIKDHLAQVFTKVTPERVGKKKKKAKEPEKAWTKLDQLDRPDLICTTVTPPANPNQIRLDIEEALRKQEEKQEMTIRVTCDTPVDVPKVEKSKVDVEYWAGRSRPFNPRASIGGFGTKYC